MMTFELKVQQIYQILSKFLKTYSAKTNLSLLHNSTFFSSCSNNVE